METGLTDSQLSPLQEAKHSSPVLPSAGHVPQHFTHPNELYDVSTLKNIKPEDEVTLICKVTTSIKHK